MGRTPAPCIKRTYESKQAALAAIRRAGWRAKVYMCDRCYKWHVANADKRD